MGQVSMRTRAPAASAAARRASSPSMTPTTTRRDARESTCDARRA